MLKPRPTRLLATKQSKQLSSMLFARLLQNNPMSINANTPTLDEIRALISAEFGAADDAWNITGPKVVQSRLDFLQ